MDVENPMIWDGREPPEKPWWQVKRDIEEWKADNYEDEER